MHINIRSISHSNRSSLKKRLWRSHISLLCLHPLHLKKDFSTHRSPIVWHNSKLAKQSTFSWHCPRSPCSFNPSFVCLKTMSLSVTYRVFAIVLVINVFILQSVAQDTIASLNENGSNRIVPGSEFLLSTKTVPGRISVL